MINLFQIDKSRGDLFEKDYNIVKLNLEELIKIIKK